MTNSKLTVEQTRLLELWQAHEYAEFVAKDPAATMATMVAEPHVWLPPSGLGWFGQQAVRHYYEKLFTPCIPSDITPTLLSYTVGQDRVVEESVFDFTHSIEMPWLIPGVAPTGRHVRIAVLILVQFAGDKIAHEHLFYDHAALLGQLGLIPIGKYAVAGADAADQLLASVSKARGSA